MRLIKPLRGSDLEVWVDIRYLHLEQQPLVVGFLDTLQPLFIANGPGDHALLEAGPLTLPLRGQQSLLLLMKASQVPSQYDVHLGGRCLPL